MIRIERSAGHLRGSDGTRLRYLAWRVPSERAAIQIVHGLGDHAARYEDFAVRAAERGLSTWAADLRGHGRSEGPRTHARNFGEFVADVLTFQAVISAASRPETPVILFGHSMGGLIAIRTLQGRPGAYRAGVLSSPWLAEPTPPPAWKEAGGRLLGWIAPAARIPNGIAAEAISSDPAVVRAYDRDPLVQRTITPALYHAARAAQAAARDGTDAFAVPLLFLLSGADEVVSTPAAEAFARAIGTGADVETFAGLRHESWNGQDSAPVFRRMFQWIEEQLARSQGDPDSAEADTPLP